MQARAAAKEGVSPLAKLGQVLKEKARGDFGRVFKGTAKTRERLSVIEELLTYWNIDEADDQLEELEEALIAADFGPKTALKVVDAIREDILGGAPAVCTATMLIADLCSCHPECCDSNSGHKIAFLSWAPRALPACMAHTQARRCPDPKAQLHT